MWRQRQRKSQTQLLSATMTLCLLFKPVASAWCHNSFVDKYHLLSIDVNVAPSFIFLFFFGKDVVPCCPHGPVTLHRAKQSVRPFVGARHLFSLFLYLSLSLSLTQPPCISLLELTIEVRRETYMFASGRGGE